MEQNMKQEEKRIDEEQVYDVHSFIQRYVGALKEQNIPINKKQIGVLEQMLLAENSPSLTPAPFIQRRDVLEQPLQLSKYRTEIENAINRLGSTGELSPQKYTNKDLLDLYNAYCGNYKNTVDYLGKKKLGYIETYLQQKDLLPTQQK